jgi:predicted HTH domain antitoxin
MNRTLLRLAVLRTGGDVLSVLRELTGFGNLVEHRDRCDNSSAGWSQEVPMAMRTLVVELPEELVDLLGSPEAAAAKAKEALVLGLLREGRVSQGQAAQLLEATRWELLELMARYKIPSGPETATEMRQEIEDIRRSSHTS